MADINQVVSLGIGTPAGVPEFLTLGLQIGEEAVPTVLPDKRLRRQDQASTVRLRRQDQRSTTRLLKRTD